MSEWTFLSNYASILSQIASKLYATALELANAVGITERAARKIIADLLTDGYIIKKREGRRNQYRINPHLPLCHPSHKETAVGELLKILHPEQHKLSATLDSEAAK